MFRTAKFCGASSGAGVNNHTENTHIRTEQGKQSTELLPCELFISHTWLWHADHGGGYLSLSIRREGRHFEEIGSVRTQLINSHWYGHAPGGRRGHGGEGDRWRGGRYLQGTRSCTRQDISRILDTYKSIKDTHTHTVRCVAFIFLTETENRDRTFHSDGTEGTTDRGDSVMQCCTLQWGSATVMMSSALTSSVRTVCPVRACFAFTANLLMRPLMRCGRYQVTMTEVWFWA